MKKTEQTTIIYPKTVLVAIQTPSNRSLDIEAYFDEFKSLVKTLKVPYIELFKIKLREIDGATFIGSGNLKKIEEYCKENFVKQVILSEPVTPNQERNLSEILHCEIFDRTRLILEIFQAAATSSEGKIQVEIALLKNRKSRLAGRGLYLSQQEGRIGTRGPGETAKEVASRHIEERIRQCRKALEELERTRATQRKQRLIKQVPLICLIGYTNVGKSTILNALTKSNVLAEDKLFATLDTTTKELYINNKKIGLLSDTVGFIQALPHHLIDAFKSTLAELKFANLLLHVVDVSDKNWKLHINVVHEVLKELGVNKPMLYVFNKIDKVDKKNIKDEFVDYLPHVIVSANDRDSLKPLIDYLEDWQPESNYVKPE